MIALDFLNYTPTLEAGAHEEGEGKLCLMEAVAFVMGLPHSDAPPCTAPEVAQFCRDINDAMPPEWRQKLWDRAELVANTNDPTYTNERLDYLAMKACTVFAATACDGVIDPSLVDDLRNAETVESAAQAAQAAVCAADNAARAGFPAAGRAAGRAARAARRAAARACQATASAAASSTVANAAVAASASASVSVEPDAAWQVVLDVLDGLLEIGREKSPAGGAAAEKLTNEAVADE